MGPAQHQNGTAEALLMLDGIFCAEWESQQAPLEIFFLHHIHLYPIEISNGASLM